MGLKNHGFDHETRKSWLFPGYGLKRNDFLGSYNQNLKINIFTPLQQIPCYCKSRFGTLRLISWWRVTFGICVGDFGAEGLFSANCVLTVQSMSYVCFYDFIVVYMYIT